MHLSEEGMKLATFVEYNPSINYQESIILKYKGVLLVCCKSQKWNERR